MWVKNILGTFCLYCSVSAEVHLEQLRPSLGAVEQKFSDGMAALHGLFHEECKLPCLTQCCSGLSMGFKDLNSSAIYFSSWKIFPNISVFSYRAWQCYCLSHVPVSVPSPCPMARLCPYSSTSELFSDLSFSFLLLWTSFTCLCLSTGLCLVQQRTVQHFHVQMRYKCLYTSKVVGEVCISAKSRVVYISRHPYSPLWRFLPLYF